jgi:putative transposase
VLHTHVVVVTTYQHRVFAGRHLRRMEEIMRDVCVTVETGLVEFTGEADHGHLPVTVPPKVAISKLVTSLTGVSSRRLRREFPDLARHSWRANQLWSGSSVAGSVGGTPLTVLRPYIEQQARPV